MFIIKLKQITNVMLWMSLSVLSYKDDAPARWLKKKKEDIKKNLTDLFSEALSSSSGGKESRPIININVTLNTDLGTVSDSQIGNNNANIVMKKEQGDNIVLQKVKFEDRALSPFAAVKSEPMDETKSCVRTGNWNWMVNGPHVDVDLIPQSVKDDEVIILQSDIPVQTSPPHESKRYFKEVPKVKCDGDFQSLQDILSRTKEARHYGDNTTGIFHPIATTACSGIGQKERSKVVGNIEFLPFKLAGHSKLSASCAEVSHSASIGTFGSSFKFPSVSMNTFGNITESSLTKEQLFGHSSKIATTASPNISPIIGPSRLILSNSPQVWRSTPPAKVSNVELEAVQRTISTKLKISDKTDVKTIQIYASCITFPRACKAQKVFCEESGQSSENKVTKIT